MPNAHTKYDMPAIPNYYNAPTMPRVYSYAMVKRYWNDAWIFVPYLNPDTMHNSVAPEVDSCTLTYELGRIKQHGTNFGADYLPLNLIDWYVVVLTQYEFYQPVVLWIGIITDDKINYDRTPNISGTQTLTARGLGHLFDREVIHNGYVLEQGDMKEIDWLPTFNERSTIGSSVIGNRTEDPHQWTDDFGVDRESYLFARNGDQWSVLDIIKYLLTFFSPYAIPIDITGQYDVLDTWSMVYDCKGKTLWQALNELIDRRRGLGFTITVGDDQVVYIVVFSIMDFPLSIGNTFLPANANPVSFTVPTQFPFQHLVQDIPFTITSVNQYDTLKIQGARIKITCSFSYADGTLTEGWDSSLESEYLSGPTSEEEETPTEEEIDQWRANYRFDSVFARHIVPKDWDWTAGDGEGGTKLNVAPYIYSDGDVHLGDPAPIVSEEETPPDDGSVQGSFWNGQKKWMRTLPLIKGYDYNENVSYIPTDDEPDFEKIMVFIKYTNPDDSNDTKWSLVNKLHKMDLKDAHCSILDNEMGIELNCSPQHYFALNHFDGAAEGSEDEPELDYEDLVITAQVETDRRFQIVLSNLANSDTSDRTKEITVPKGQYWWIHPDTVVGINSVGGLKRNAIGNAVLRNDVELLRSVACFAAAWYGVQRQAVEIPVSVIGLFAPLGSLLVSINSLYTSAPVRTILTSRDIDFREQRTILRTAWSEMQFGEIMEGVE